jgi:hypothetical protein
LIKNNKNKSLGLSIITCLRSRHGLLLVTNMSFFYGTRRLYKIGALSVASGNRKG